MSPVELISIHKGISHVVLLSKRYKNVIFMRLATPRVLLNAFLGQDLYQLQERLQA